MAFSVQLNGWTTSGVECGLTVRWSSDKESLCNTGMYSQFAVVEPERAGRGISADVAACETPLQYQIWFFPDNKSPAVFFH